MGCPKGYVASTDATIWRYGGGFYVGAVCGLHSSLWLSVLWLKHNTQHTHTHKSHILSLSKVLSNRLLLGARLTNILSFASIRGAPPIV